MKEAEICRKIVKICTLTGKRKKYFFFKDGGNTKKQRNTKILLNKNDQMNKRRQGRIGTNITQFLKIIQLKLDKRGINITDMLTRSNIKAKLVIIL